MDGFSKRLKEIRKDLKITQNEFANAFGVKLTVISKYETGLIKPSFEMLFKMASAYHVSLDWLILGIGEKYLPNVCLKNGTDDEIVSVTQEITSQNGNFLIKSFEKATGKENNTIQNTDEDIVDLIIKIATKLSENPKLIEQLKKLAK